MDTISDDAADVLELPAYKDLLWKEKTINRFAAFTQYITWPFLFVLFHALFDLRIKGQDNFSLVKKPFIIIAHHVAFYDSFLFRLVLGPFTPHLPLRFMAVTKFDWKFLNAMAMIGVIDFIYSLFGVFTITPGLGLDKNLEKAKEIIKAGGNIVMYPEGKITLNDAVGPFKRGAAALMKTTGVSMIPVSFRLGSRNWLRRRLYINIGGPMHILPEMSVDQITESFYEAVEGLFERR